MSAILYNLDDFRTAARKSSARGHIRGALVDFAESAAQIKAARPEPTHYSDTLGEAFPFGSDWFAEDGEEGWPESFAFLPAPAAPLAIPSGDSLPTFEDIFGMTPEQAFSPDSPDHFIFKPFSPT